MRTRPMILALAWLGLSFPPGATWALAQAPSGGGEKKSAKTGTEPRSSLRMSDGVVCRSINGYEDFEVLPKAAQTSDEKLLVYFRPLGFRSEWIDGAYEAHLVPDFEIRKRGQKAVLLQKQKMYTYKPRGPQPPRYLYMKNTISLKGLAPGDYDLTLILHDEIAKGAPATQVVRFRVIPPIDPTKDEKAKP